MAFGEEDLLSLSFRNYALLNASLPTSALFLCILISVMFHFEEATNTHCHVANWLPSISAAVSTFAPEMYIWRLFLSISGGPRIFFAFAERNYLMYSPLRPHSNLGLFNIACRIACLLNIGENLFLLGLTSISSVENHGAHKLCFMGFAFTATIHMVLSTFLFHYSGRRRSTNLGEKSYEYKVLACAISAIAIMTAMYFYWRHNTYCEPGVYTLFALSEYCIVLANIAFHMTVYYDFYGKRVCLSSVNEGFNYQLLPTVIDKNT